MTDADQPPVARRNGPANSPWRNAEICKRVGELWRNHSATQIAEKLYKEFRIDISRNSIVGYLHRQRITIQQKTEVHPLTNNHRGMRPKIKPPTSVNVQKVRAARTAPQPKPEPFICAPVVDVVPLHLTLDLLKDDMCRFPYGEAAPFTFCSHQTLTGRSWCAQHHKVVTVPTPQRRPSAPFIARGRAA